MMTARDQVEGEHGGDGTLHILLPFGADVLGDENGASHRQAADELDDQDRHLAAHGDGGGANRPAEAADDQHIRHVVQRLEQIGQQKRQREAHQLPHYTATGQIILELAQWINLP